MAAERNLLPEHIPFFFILIFSYTARYRLLVIITLYDKSKLPFCILIHFTTFHCSDNAYSDSLKSVKIKVFHFMTINLPNFQLYYMISFPQPEQHLPFSKQKKIENLIHFSRLGDNKDIDIFNNISLFSPQCLLSYDNWGTNVSPWGSAKAVLRTLPLH